MRRRVVAIMALGLLVLTGVYLYMHGFEAMRRQAGRPSACDGAWDALKNNVVSLTRGFHGSSAIVVEELKTGRRFAMNEDTVVPSASLVKIPIMMAYFSAAAEGKADLNEMVEVKRSDITDGSGILKSAPAGSSYRLEDLIGIMITQSDNTAANILIEKMGFEELNRYFAKMGLRHTNIVRKMMDFKLRKRGVENYTTARDMADAVEKIYRGHFINKEVSQKCLAFLAKQKIRDRIPKRLPADTPVAHKTGLENGVCHDVGVVYTPNGDFLICALARHKYTTARPAKNMIADISLLIYNYCNPSGGK